MTKSDGEAAFLGCILMLVLLPFSILLRAFVLTQLWAWFVVPFGIVQIGLAWAYGLSTAVAMFTQHSSPKSSEDEEISKLVARFMGMAFGMPLLCWLAGWICHMFM